MRNRVLSMVLIGFSLLFFSFFVFFFHSYKQEVSDSQVLLNPSDSLMKQRLYDSVSFLSETIGPRNLTHYDSLNRAANYIEDEFLKTGFSVTIQHNIIDGLNYMNIQLSLINNENNPEYVVLGAHYDSHYDSPGANDNATGIAVLLEIARNLLTLDPEYNYILVAFSNEEEPFHKTDQMGSFLHAKDINNHELDVKFMINLDMLGYYTVEEVYAFPLSLLFGKTGNSVIAIGNLRGKDEQASFLNSFSDHCPISCYGISTLAFMPYVSDSDHWSYGRYGYPSFQISDSGGLRGAEIHNPEDTIEQIDFDRLAMITKGILFSLQNLD